MKQNTLHIDIPETVQTALTALEAAGFEAYLVGGCVRDALLGESPEDFDITTSALPEQIAALFEPDYPLIESGKKHGTIAPIMEGQPIEITTFRIDGDYSDRRHPDSVVFSARLADDLSRRDFTVNAMAYSERAGLIDYFGGSEDLRCKCIRCVGAPDGRFAEDALRMLRALRFAAVLGFDVEAATAESIRAHFEEIRAVSVERIYVELKKLLNGSDAARVLETFPCLTQTLFDITPSAQTLAALHAARDGNLRFALLFAGDAPQKLLRLKPDKKTYAYVKSLCEWFALPFDALQKGGREMALFCYENGITTQLLKDLAQMHGGLTRAFDSSQFDGAYDEMMRLQLPIDIAHLQIGGVELEALGYRGKAIKCAQDRLLRAVIGGSCVNETAALIKEATKRL